MEKNGITDAQIYAEHLRLQTEKMGKWPHISVEIQKGVFRYTFIVEGRMEPIRREGLRTVSSGEAVKIQTIVNPTLAVAELRKKDPMYVHGIKLELQERVMAK